MEESGLQRWTYPLSSNHLKQQYCTTKRCVSAPSGCSCVGEALATLGPPQQSQSPAAPTSEVAVVSKQTTQAASPLAPRAISACAGSRPPTASAAAGPLLTAAATPGPRRPLPAATVTPQQRGGGSNRGGSSANTVCARLAKIRQNPPTTAGQPLHAAGRHTPLLLQQFSRSSLTGQKKTSHPTCANCTWYSWKMLSNML